MLLIQALNSVTFQHTLSGETGWIQASTMSFVIRYFIGIAAWDL
jgi:hypothetical protein